MPIPAHAVVEECSAGVGVISSLNRRVIRAGDGYSVHARRSFCISDTVIGCRGSLELGGIIVAIQDRSIQLHTGGKVGRSLCTTKGWGVWFDLNLSVGSTGGAPPTPPATSGVDSYLPRSRSWGNSDVSPRDNPVNNRARSADTG